MLESTQHIFSVRNKVRASHLHKLCNDFLLPREGILNAGQLALNFGQIHAWSTRC